MVKNNNSNRGRRARNTTSRSVVYRGVAEPLIGHVSNQINAFSDQACGKKLHDANQSNSFTLTSRSRHTMSVNDEGSGYLEVNPYLTAEIKQYTPGATGATGMSTSGVLGSGITTASFDANDLSVISPVAKRFRIVSYGIKVVCLQAPLDAQGILMIREITETQLGNDNDVMKYAEVSHTTAINHNLELAIIPNANGDRQYEYSIMTQAYNSAIGGDGTMPPFKVIALSIIGAKGGTIGLPVLSVEIIKHLELLPEVDGAFRLVTTPAAVDHYGVRQAISNTRRELPVVNEHKGLMSKVKALATRALHGLGNAAVGAAGRLLASYIGAPAGLLSITNGSPSALEVN